MGSHRDSGVATLTFERALCIAAEAHEGQRYGHEPYILHPLRVSERVSDDQAKLVALLHDVIEDTPLNKRDLLLAGAPAYVALAVEIVSRREDETYRDYIERVATAAGPAGRLARIVKRADLEENLSQRFGTELSLKRRYLRALDRLTEADE